MSTPEHTDTGLWRMAIEISRRGVSAWLRHVSDASLPVRRLLDERWTPDGDSQLRNVENVVYSNPSVLEDYSTEIIIVADKAMWVPASMLRGEEDVEALFSGVYKCASAEDIFADVPGDEGEVCIYTPGAGVRSFLNRTFPGARVMSQASLMVSRFRRQQGERLRIYADLRGDRIDLALFDGTSLSHWSTHVYDQPADGLYHVLNTLDICDADATATQVCLSGDRNQREELAPLLRGHLPYVTITTLPRLISDVPLPTAALLSLSRVRGTDVTTDPS